MGFGLRQIPHSATTTINRQQTDNIQQYRAYVLMLCIKCMIVSHTVPLKTYVNLLHVITRRRSDSAYICQVHDNVMMYMSTHLHTHLPSNVCGSRRRTMIMTSSIMTACCGVTGVCGKSIGIGVNIFVHFFSTPILILNLTMSSESQENDISNDILSRRKYSQFFTHESIRQTDLRTPRSDDVI